jgi:hypothetical protein
VISKLSSIVPSRRVRGGLAVIALALVLVPTLARARQQVERRDSTRLSIKHSWVGVAPPTKASVTTAPVAVLPAVAPRVERLSPQPRILCDGTVTLHESPQDLSDPLRGPPSRLS